MRKLLLAVLIGTAAAYAQNVGGSIQQVGAGGGTGTVTNIATTGPITGGPITTTGTVACATCNTSAASLASGQILVGAGGQAIQTGNLSGDVSTAGSGVTTLATVNAGPGACGDATHVCQVTTNGKGLTTSQSAVTITGFVTSAAGTTNTIPKYSGAAALANSSITDNGTTVSTPESFSVNSLHTINTAGLTTLDNGLTTAGNGHPIEVANLATASLNANTGTVTLYTPAAAGFYRIVAYLTQIDIGVGCTATSTLSFRVSYTDGHNAAVLGPIALFTISGATTTGSTIPLSFGTIAAANVGFGQYVMYSAASAISYSTAIVPGAGCTTNPHYQINAALEVF